MSLIRIEKLPETDGFTAREIKALNEMKTIVEIVGRDNYVGKIPIKRFTFEKGRAAELTQQEFEGKTPPFDLKPPDEYLKAIIRIRNSLDHRGNNSDEGLSSEHQKEALNALADLRDKVEEKIKKDPNAIIFPEKPNIRQVTVGLNLGEILHITFFTQGLQQGRIEIEYQKLQGKQGMLDLFSLTQKSPRFTSLRTYTNQWGTNQTTYAHMPTENKQTSIASTNQEVQYLGNLLLLYLAI